MIRIALTNLKKYNEGELVFEWVDLPQDDFTHVFNKIGHDEFFISDYECELPIAMIDEYENLETLNEIAEILENLQDYEKETLLAILESETLLLDEALEILNDEKFIFYSNVNLEGLAEQFVEEGIFGEISTSIISYIDYERIARDLKFEGYIETSVGVIVYE